jgi:hypothetical protein
VRAGDDLLCNYLELDLRRVPDGVRARVRVAYAAYRAAAEPVEAAVLRGQGVTAGQLRPLQAALSDAFVRLAAAVEAAAQAEVAGSGLTDHARRLFQATADPPRLTGLDLSGGVAVINRYLPPSARGEDCFGILVAGGTAYGIHNGWKRDDIPHDGRWYGAGLLRYVDLSDLPGQTGKAFRQLKSHVEPMVAGFLRKHQITSATLYINKQWPCQPERGKPTQVRCFPNMKYLLAPGTRLVVYGTAGPEDFSGVEEVGA